MNKETIGNGGIADVDLAGVLAAIGVVDDNVDDIKLVVEALPARLDIVDDSLEILHDHIHSAQKVYPTLANGVTVTGAAGAWALGAFAVLVPTNAIASPFDIHHINVAAYNASDTFELVLYAGANGAEVEIGRVRFSRISNVGAAPHVPMMTPINPANSQIKAKIASQNGTSNTATISIDYHTY
jgi:hypothetical protein